MKRIIAITLTLAMAALLLCGCGNDRTKLEGTWQTEVDLSQQVNQMILGEVSEYFDFSNFTITFLLTLNADGTYSLRPEETSAKAAFDSLLVRLKDGFIKFYEAEIAEAGLDMTVEELLATRNTTMDDLIETLRKTIEEDGLAAELVKANTREGQFDAKDGKLYLSAGLEYGVDENVYDTYTLEGNTLTLTAHVGGNEDTQLIYPQVFQKVS